MPQPNPHPKPSPSQKPSSLRDVEPNPRFRLPLVSSEFRMVDVLCSPGALSGTPSDAFTHQLSALYAQAQSAGRWKYDPPPMVLSGLGRIPGYHILAAMKGEQIVGTVRAIFLPGANMVFGSCLVVDRAFQKRGLALPLIGAAMSVADQDSRRNGIGEILGAVLGVDDDPVMRTFHANWGVRYISKEELPFTLPSIDGREPEKRIWGIRLEGDSPSHSIPVAALQAILADLKDLEIALGYPPEAAVRVYSYLMAKLAGTPPLALWNALQYPNPRAAYDL